ncbi:MAG: DUF4340 domain-containing protein [Candidatus Rokuibacteriota bacterium]
MRWQTTALLAILLIAVGAFYYVYEIRWGPEREQAESRKGRVFDVDTADVTELTLQRGNEVVRLAREGDGWRMTAPLAWRGERGPIEETLTSVATARMDREIAASPADLAEFGLDKPVAEVTLATKGGKQLGLVLGAKSPTGVWVYAQERGKPAVFVVGDGVLRDATRPLADFRSKAVLAFDRKEVTGVEIVTRDETLAVEPAGERGWRMTRPRALEADPDAVAGLLEKLAGAKVREFVAETPRSLAPYGLERPVRVAIHVGKDKDRATRTILLGNADDKKKGVYAMRPGETTVLLLPEDVSKAVPRTTAALRDKTVIALERDKVGRLEVESPRGAVTLVREQDKWRITQPEALPADQVEAGAVLMRLVNLKALAFLSEDASAIPRYLARPEVRVTIGGQDAASTQTLVLAPSPEKRGGQATAYAAVAGRGPVVLVDASALTEIGRPLRQLRDRTLVAGLEPRDVKRVHVKREGKTVLVERTGDTEWRVVEGGKGTANTAKVEDLIYGLRGLKWQDVAAPDGGEAAKFGLDAPAAEVTLYRADGTAIATVLVGRQEGDRRYVQVKAAPAVYTIDAKQLTLPKVPEDFQS